MKYSVSHSFFLFTFAHTNLTQIEPMMYETRHSDRRAKEKIQAILVQSKTEEEEYRKRKKSEKKEENIFIVAAYNVKFVCG